MSAVPDTSAVSRLPMSAGEVLVRFWDGSLPVNPIAIAQHMGVSVYKDASLDVSGVFWFLPDNTPAIAYNPKEKPTTRQRFTIAHELGHYSLCHGRRFRDGRASFSKNNYEIPEVEANAFASDLLMPDHQVRAYSRAWGQTLDTLSSIFDVSRTAMQIKLQSLGIIRNV